MLVLALAACGYGCTGLTSAGSGFKADTLGKIAVSNVGASSLTATAATITWITNVAASSEALYGTSSSYGQSTTLNGTMLTSHSVGLSSLTASTLYHYEAVSTDASGNVAQSGDLTFTTPAASNAPPTVSLTAPTAGATVSGSTVTVSANASASAALTMASVQFLVDGSNLGSPVQAVPWTTAWNTTGVSNGTHSLSALATDSAGDKTTSAAVSVTVNNPVPPTISISAPVSGTTVSGTVTVTTSASANTTSVQFQLDGNNTGAAGTSAPFSYSLNTTTLSNATHSITAVASNAAAQTTTSAAVSVTVSNPLPPTASTTLDSYGGTQQLACPNGPAPHFYVQELNARWWMCTPSGNAFWLQGVYHADASDNVVDYQGIIEDGSACTANSPPSVNNPCSVIVQKYGDANVTWGPQTVRRLQSWGFNATAEYSSAYVQPTTINSSWNTPDYSNPQKMPFIGLVWPAHYARNANAYAQPVKDIVGPVNPSVFTGYRSSSPDVFDPNFLLWLQKELADPSNTEYNWIHSAHSDYLIGLNVDDLDDLNGFGAGADFPTLTNGYPDSGIGRWQPHLGWIVLVTPPTQSSGTDGNGNPISYSDTTVYSKLALGSWLSTRYSGSIAALNQAWGSTYTTFGSAGGWGAGSGVLDEDGTHSWVPSDPYKLSGATAAMQTDLDAFLLYYAQQYFSVIKSTLQAAAPGVLYLGPTSLGTWGTPARRQILQAAAQFLDVLVLPSIPTGCIACTDDQQRVDFVALYGGNKPWMNWEGFFGQPDSYMSVYAAPDTSFPQSSTQDLRGQLFANMVTGMLNSTDTPTGTYHFVGYKWWELYDNRGEQANWGLLTRRDNAYDGKQAVMAAGTDAWGYPTGGELGNYGDFLGAVTTANQNIYKTLLP